MKAPLAVMTLVRNEPFFLPRWLEYYGRIPGARLVVLDHETDDGSTDDLPAGVERCRVREFYAERAAWMLETVQEKMASLLRDFDRVIYAEVDEFLIPDIARWPDLGTFLACHHGSVASQGWHVVHKVGDAPLPAEGSMLKGRMWKREHFYDMTLVCDSVPQWNIGRHGLRDRPNGPDVGLRMVHLHYACPDLGWRRSWDRRRNKLPAADGMGFQNKFIDRNDFDRHWTDMCSGGEPIPDEWSKAL